MNIREAKQVDICNFLNSIGIKCAKRTQADAWYYAPGRAERTASFHVYNNGTRWYDFGFGRGGDIIDLVKQMFNISNTHEALAKIEELVPSSSVILPGKEKNYSSERQRQCRVIATGELSTDLLMYSRSRGIHDDVIMRVCRRVDFSIKSGKRLHAIGFRNDKGGWELRNSFYKGCIGPKSITSMIELADAPIVIFEGVFDYMSSIELEWMSPVIHNAIILNSVSLIETAMPFLFSRQVILCLDNDAAGRSAADKIKCQCEVIDDWSFRYSSCKDISDFLIK